MPVVLAINPGSTSTKIGLFEDNQCLVKETLRHTVEETSPELPREDQAAFRRDALMRFMKEKKIAPEDISAFVVRGGLLKPLKSGVYEVDDRLYQDLISAKFGWHASNLGSIIALPLGRELGIPVYTVDPVTVDEFGSPARYTGLKGLPRLSMSHALNMKAMARRTADLMNRSYGELNLIVVHLGSGISVSAHRQGRMVDVNNANEEGPFSLERCGTLPALGLARLCYSGRYGLDDMIRLLTSQAGIYSYLGTKDFKMVEKEVSEGNSEALEVVTAMAYQVAKEIGAMATVLSGNVDRIVLTGGMAYAETLTSMTKERVEFIAPVEILPGEEELEALAAGAFRVLSGEEEVLKY
ncbi:MAG: butyrate kinase [Firmicutes bacterium]|nr:butyrate kinase [Bacillota bacterium]